MKKNPFTLVELLCVIVVIAIIVSLLIGTMAKARQRAEFVVCFNNSKQVAAATVSYTMITKGTLPTTNSGGSFDSRLSVHLNNFTPAMVALQGIKVSDKIPGGKIWVCPLSKTQVVTDPNAPQNGNRGAASASDPYQARSYVMNGQATGGQSNVDAGAGFVAEGSSSAFKISKVVYSPSDILLIIERDTLVGTRGWYRSGVTGSLTKWTASTGLHPDRPGFFTTVMLDGSAQFLNWRDVQNKGRWKPLAP